jgi:hypothetical protein
VDEVAQMVATVKRTGVLAEVSGLERAAAAEQEAMRREHQRDEAARTSSIPKVRPPPIEHPADRMSGYCKG